MEQQWNDQLFRGETQQDRASKPFQCQVAVFVGPGIVPDGLRFVAAALECGSFTDDIYISYHSFLQDVLRICRSSICPWWLWLSLLSFFRRCQWYSHTSWMHAIIWTSQMCMNVSSHSFSKLDETEICQKLPKIIEMCNISPDLEKLWHRLCFQETDGKDGQERHGRHGEISPFSQVMGIPLEKCWKIGKVLGFGDTPITFSTFEWGITFGGNSKCDGGTSFFEITFGGFWIARRSFWNNSSPLAVWARA